MLCPVVPPLTESARAVLRVLASQGPATRPKLGSILELSKPTMSAAVSELSKAGLVISFSLADNEASRFAKAASTIGRGRE
jgi:DNA-binding MarR family transcriptional regulator